MRSLRKIDPLAVRREERPAVVAPLAVVSCRDVRAVGVHDVQFEIAGPLRAEDDLLAVGRILTFGVVTVGIGQPFQAVPSGFASKMSMCLSKSQV